MPITSGAEYIESLRGRDIKVYLFGELVKEPVDHPMIRPSINAVAETYDIANSEPEIGSSHSSLTDRKIRAVDRYMFSTMRRNGCTQFPLFHNF